MYWRDLKTSKSGESRQLRLLFLALRRNKKSKIKKETKIRVKQINKPRYQNKTFTYKIF